MQGRRSEGSRHSGEVRRTGRRTRDQSMRGADTGRHADMHAGTERPVKISRKRASRVGLIRPRSGLGSCGRQDAGSQGEEQDLGRGLAGPAPREVARMGFVAPWVKARHERRSSLPMASEIHIKAATGSTEAEGIAPRPGGSASSSASRCQRQRNYKDLVERNGSRQSRYWQWLRQGVVMPLRNCCANSRIEREQMHSPRPNYANLRAPGNFAAVMR